MHVRMPFQRLAPGVQDHQAADPRPQVPRCGGDFQRGLGHGANQEVVKHDRIRGRHRHQFVGRGQHHMMILDRQQFPLTGREPGRPVTGLTFGTVAIAARVVQRRLGVTRIAAVNVASHPGRPTSGQCRQRFAVLDSQTGSAGCEERGSETADDLADFEREPRFRGGVWEGP